MHEATHERFMPEEAIELTEALVAFTAGSAYASHLDEAGTIAVGRLADLAVLDRDLFDRGAGADRATRGSWRRSSTGSPCTRRPSSTAERAARSPGSSRAHSRPGRMT